jgi:quinoprotein glucose dehydrogenase
MSRVKIVTSVTAGAAVMCVALLAQNRRDAEWPMFRHDAAGTGRSPLTQITPDNVARLAQVWTYKLQIDAGGGRPLSSEATPIVVNGVMYLPAANRIVALDPETGKEVWQYAVTGPSRRGVAFWPGDAAHPPRIIFTAGRRLIALNAKTGTPEPTFGKDGEVDMVIPYNSVPFVHGHVVVAGANTPPGAIGGVGNPRAFDAVTGARLWEFSSVAQPGQPGHDTWEGDSWKNRLGVNAWPFYFTMDEQRGLLYVPLASPVPDPYGGDRKGANLYGNSVVALDIETGKYRWHFQTIHHDLWDADPPAPPGLLDVTRNGRTIPALALTTKSGYVYILNRETGQPVFGVEERPVAKSDVPGELAFATQPMPIKPPPIARNEFKPQDLVTADDTTAAHAAACRELVDKNGIYNAGPFTPWAYRAAGAPPKTALVFPGGLGGANWGGTAYDARSGYVFVATQDVGALGWMESKGGSVETYDKTAPERPSGRGVFDVRTDNVSWPCQKPPWGRLIAINTSTGDFAWQVRLGVTDNLPAGKQNTGRPVLAGPIVTASGVLFIASTDDNRFRALDVRNGRELWVTKLDRRGNADPITYQGEDGRQYVAIVATDTVSAFALP